MARKNIPADTAEPGADAATPGLGRGSRRRRIVVAGAGPGGLAAAMLAAAAGAEVTVLEAQDRVGGRTSSFGADGFTFDLGPTFFLYPEILASIFRTCGFRLEDEVELRPIDPMYDLIFEDGGRIRATPDIAALQAEVARFSSGDAAHVPAFIADNAAKFERFGPLLQRPFLGPASLLGRDMLRALPRFRPWSTVDRDLHRYFTDPRVRLAFSFQSKYLGMSPFKCPSLFTIIAHVEYGFGVYHPVGGCGAVMAAMARCARRMGVDIRLSEPISELSFTGRRATGARTAAGEYPADAVVMNTDFAGSLPNLVPDRLRRRWSDRKLAAKRYSCSTFMLYLGIEGQSDLAHHTINLSEDYVGNIRDIEARRAPEDPTIYIQNACVTDPALAPDGHSTLYVLAPVGNLQGDHTDWAATAPAYRERILDRLDSLGLDDLRPRIRFERMWTPVDWESRLGVYRGATFNLAHNLGQMLHWRPHNRFEEVGGVYLTGGGTHPGSGLPMIFESARIATNLMAADLGLDTAGLASSPLQAGT